MSNLCANSETMISIAILVSFKNHMSLSHHEEDLGDLNTPDFQTTHKGQVKVRS